MSFPKELSEVVLFVAKALDSFNDARADGKVTLAESIGLAAKLAPATINAVRGIGDIPAELRALDQAAMDTMYEAFLTELEWEPSDNARDKLAVAFEVTSAVLLGAIKWANTVRPPVATIVP